MKSIKILLVIIAAIYLPSRSFSQNINWATLQKDQKHIVTVKAGYDYGLVSGAGYGYQLRSKLPIILSGEFTFPSGDKLLDDFKTKIGGQIKFYQTGNFHFTGKFAGLFRRYESDFVRLLNFGCELSGTAGYYKHRWFVAGETGFDKAIVTHFKHSARYKEDYPFAQDGWYEPATGGNFHYGLQTGYSGKRKDVYLKFGKVVTQDFKTTPLAPFYLQLGLNVKLK